MKKIIFIVLSLMIGLVNAQSKDFGADRHVQKGVTCESCHGPSKDQEPTIERCQKCHSLDQVAKKTENVKPRNPHVSPHYQNKLDCVNCHYMHEQPQDFCAQCHTFGFKVP